MKDQFGLKGFYKRSIIGVWLFGFFADIIGAVFLFAVLIAGNSLGMPHEIDYAISYDPFSQPIAVLVILFAMVISSVFIFFFNYRYTFKQVIEDKKIRVRVALTIATVSIPWTFLIPTKWFFKFY
ncbi:hypothetical protein IEO70_00925 [Bacillus sp. AGMB 02131]|uniref:Uncharacterized protein n=1 Tax=Peribacillus faecalis TaxID=2772559 RepID=A0A927H8W6_9BACI|nr:hypothetical protein [Peribacillus faecalis]MBD3106940.1 hypothetical protein [Peribacillus faecalis]